MRMIKLNLFGAIFMSLISNHNICSQFSGFAKKIAIISLFIFPFLYFSLSGLGLTCIPAELMQPLPNLEEVDLSKNKLTAIVQVGTLPQVKVINFANNQLSNVDGLKAFPNLESLDVTNNPTLEVTRSKLISHLPRVV